jgi:hypothetical protein
MNIVINSIVWPTFNWREKQQTQSQLAGISPGEQKRLNAESSQRNPMLGDAYFESDIPFPPGTNFSVEGDSRQFVVSINDGGRIHWANRLNSPDDTAPSFERA